MIRVSIGQTSRLNVYNKKIDLQHGVRSEVGKLHVHKQAPSEDDFTCECPLREQYDTALFCVFDGHAGRGAAEKARTMLPAEMAAQLEGLDEKGLQAVRRKGLHAKKWREVFLRTDKALGAEYEGCTATALLVHQDPGGKAVYLQAGNVGDSSCIVGNAQGHEELTCDHRLSDRRERARLAAAGVKLRDGEDRLYGLSLSRALGDQLLKNEDVGLTAEPHVSKVVQVVPGLGPQYAILASDGLWDHVNKGKVMQIAEEVGQRSDQQPEAIAAALIERAQFQRSTDDISVVVVVLSTR